MNTWLENGWVQSIGGSLIGSLLFFFGRRLVVKRNYRLILSGVGLATILLCICQMLEPAVRFLIEGNNPAWQFLITLRQTAPGYFLMSVLLNNVVPGVITGMAVISGKTLKQRVAYGATGATLSLCLVDVIGIYLIHNLPALGLFSYSWSDLYFSFLSNLGTGVVAGFLIGAALHLYMERSAI
jgi:hypothetical protein